MASSEARKVAPMLRDWAEVAIGAGWRIVATNGGHLRWNAPSGAFVFTAATPTDHRARMNVRSRLRHAGLEI